MRWIADIRQDVGYALRTLRASPGFAMIAVLSLALGIGATTAIYSVVDAILLQPLPFADSGRLVRVVENLSFVAGRPPIQGSISYEHYLEWRARTTTLTDTHGGLAGLDAGTDPRRHSASMGRHGLGQYLHGCCKRAPCWGERSTRVTMPTPT